MKKILCILLALVLAVGAFGGCRQKEEENSYAPEVSQTTPTETAQKNRRIGVVQYVEYAPLDEAREAFMSRLDEWGLDDGELQIDYQNAGGDGNRAAEICQRLVEDKTDVIVAISAPAARAASQAAAGTDTKVVFLGVGDAGADVGLQNLTQPEGNVTGVADAPSAQSSIDLARQVNPSLATVGLLYDPSCPLGATYVQRFKDYCAQNSIALVEGQVADASEVQQRMTELCGQVDAIFTPVDTTVAASAKDAAAAATAAGKPWYVCTQDMVRQGAMASVGIDYTEAGNRAADMAVQMAVGRPASGLPVYSFGSGQVSVNQDAMSALAADVPEAVLSTAIYCQPQAAE